VQVREAEADEIGLFTDLLTEVFRMPRRFYAALFDMTQAWRDHGAKLYFGLDGPEPMTLEEIGSLLGITRERVRQIKEKALSRLRHVSRARSLESFLT